MRDTRRRLALLAGVSIPTLAMPGGARAATVAGVHQSSVALDAINIYEIAGSDPVADYGAIETLVSLGAAATAIAEVSCAETGTCTNPGRRRTDRDRPSQRVEPNPDSRHSEHPRIGNGVWLDRACAGA